MVRSRQPLAVQSSTAEMGPKGAFAPKLADERDATGVLRRCTRRGSSAGCACGTRARSPARTRGRQGLGQKGHDRGEPATEKSIEWIWAEAIASGQAAPWWARAWPSRRPSSRLGEGWIPWPEDVPAAVAATDGRRALPEALYASLDTLARSRGRPAPDVLW